ncbi:MAG: hypothetical protein HFE65_05495 [Clostridiales bacterium]|jgi:hypothetical protein|nr:hypothetical protein [Clostridiales bacterium]
MDRQIEKLLAYTEDLKQALSLECSKEEAKKYGTVREWNAINRNIKRLKRKIRPLQDREKTCCGDGSLLYVTVLCLTVLLWITKLVCTFGLVCIVLYLVSLKIGIAFSLTTAIAIWFVLCIVYCICKRVLYLE